MIEEVKLLAQRQMRSYYVNGTISKHFKESHLTVAVPQSIDVMVMQLTGWVTGERINEIKYPLDWWEHFRQRWFPKFLLEKYPVKFRIYKIDVQYPEDGSAKVRIYDSLRSKGYPHFEGEYHV